MASPSYYTVIVQYPANAKFDIDYYTGTHMPLVAAEFKQFGFKGYSVTTNLTTPDANTLSPTSVLAVLFFDNAEGFTNALKATGEKVLDDISNFSDKNPTFIGGTTIASTVSL
ncbi:hypothetical protein DV736_g6454, partial [Chaetothyriales sp. CBS 134916]